LIGSTNGFIFRCDIKKHHLFGVTFQSRIINYKRINVQNTHSIRKYFHHPNQSIDNLFLFPGHPHFFNQLSCGLDLVSMAGEWLTATANTNMFTYEIAPVFILMENVVLSKMREIIGWTTGDSILAPGGSISNLYAFLAARHKMFPDYKEHGPRGLPGDLVMFTSDQCHYSIKSCASVCGLGTDNCVMVPSDELGRIIPSELERLIIERKSRGQIPFFVNGTAGTTVLGAFDPINTMADICEKYNCWLHIDVRNNFGR
jgi:glutamate decarboxylase